MLDKAKKIAKIFFYTIVLLICFFGIIPLFINFLVNTTNPFGIGFINEENKDTWINFFGTIIGGGLTLLGVWWTIKEQNKNLIKQQEQLDRQRRENFAIQYRPIFTCSIIPLKNLKMYYVKISNVGRSEAEIYSISIQNIDNDIYFEYFISNFEKISILAANDSFECSLIYKNINNNYENIKYNKKIVMNYFNPITKQKGVFEKKFIFDMTKIDNTPFLILFDGESNHQIVEEF